MPVPRRFDRRPPERDLTRINERIRVPEVRLIGEDGQQVGIMRTPDALRYAQTRDLDLVEVAPEARPPVARVLDYSKYKYEQAQRQKQARKHQQQITVREIKLRPKIAQNDYDTKRGHVERFLRHKDKVKVTIMFRGREVTHPERGEALLRKLAGELEDIGVVEQMPLQDGRNMTMLMAPSKAILAAAEAAKPVADGAGADTAPAQAPEVGGEPSDGGHAGETTAEDVVEGVDGVDGGGVEVDDAEAGADGAPEAGIDADPEVDRESDDDAQAEAGGQTPATEAQA